jgi:DNA primase
MPQYTKDSLELLRQRVDLYEVLAPFVQFGKNGAFYKAKCPFHEEKTPSFMIQKGDNHYHCFGCGAHGDSIAFLMNHEKMSFSEAVEYLAERFGVHLEFVDKEEYKGPNKKELKEVLEKATSFYQFFLLHTQEGKQALEYLFSRGITVEFIQKFRIGLSPYHPYIFQKAMYEQRIKKDLLELAGLIRIDSMGKVRDFFSDRIMIPIQDSLGAVIGFSSRKYKEETFGGKYINTSETPLFKKKRILFGLNYCKKTIVQEKKALLVEGQLDAMRLIHEGFTYTLASQGTAFTEEHVQELMSLGVRQVYLAFDPDKAGQAAQEKAGDLFQKEAIEVFCLSLPLGYDPDKFILQRGTEAFQEVLDQSVDYLTFLVKKLSQTINIRSPAGKNELVKQLIARIRLWKHPLMIHESLRKIAKLTETPQEVMQTFVGNNPIPKQKIEMPSFDPNRVLEMEVLRILLLFGQTEKEIVSIAKNNLKKEHFRLKVLGDLFSLYFEALKENKPTDFLSLAIHLSEQEGQQILAELLEKRVKKEKVLLSFKEACQKILEREWMAKREEIKQKIQNSDKNQDEVESLAKEFDKIKNERPQLILMDE